MKTTITRLKHAVQDREVAWGREIQKKELAKAAGVSSPAVSNWWNNEMTKLNAKCVFGLAEFLGISAEWLQSGRGEMLATNHNSSQRDASIIAPEEGVIAGSEGGRGGSLDEEELPQPTDDEFAYVPQLDIAAACGNGRFEDHVVVKGGLAFKKSFLRDEGVPEHAARIIYAVGGSMAPQIQDGRVVLINMAEKEPREGKIFLICMPDGGLVLKRLVRDYHPAVGAVVWIMKSDNPDKTVHPDKILPPDDRTIIAGRAVWTDSLL